VATWDTWFSEVLVHAPGAPDPLVLRAVSRAAREFFQRTRAWMEWLDPVASGDAPDYAFELPRETEMVRIERATADGQPFPVRSYRLIPSDWTRTDTEERSLVSRDLQTFVLTGNTPAGLQLPAPVSLMPSRRARGIPDHLADRYLEPIAEGAKEILLLTPGSFADAAAAGLARAKFDAAIAAHAVDAFMGHAGQVPRARVSWF
jgi:hypothetical protein